MSQDRFIYWLDGSQPYAQEIQWVIEDFFNGSAIIKWDTDRFFINLNGVPKHPLSRIIKLPESIQTQRWIEVWIGAKCLSVLTRQQDEYTNVLADGLAEVFIRYWKR